MIYSGIKLFDTRKSFGDCNLDYDGLTAPGTMILIGNEYKGDLELDGSFDWDERFASFLPTVDCIFIANIAAAAKRNSVGVLFCDPPLGKLYPWHTFASYKLFLKMVPNADTDPVFDMIASDVVKSVSRNSSVELSDWRWRFRDRHKSYGGIFTKYTRSSFDSGFVRKVAVDFGPFVGVGFPGDERIRFERADLNGDVCIVNPIVED